MAELPEVRNYLQALLRVDETPDYPPAHNGVQLANDGFVGKVGAAVDACLPVIQQAVDAEVDFLVVHHGLFWSGVQMIEGAYYEKLKLAMEHNLAIYSAHIPLDVHEIYGNNVLLAKALGLEETTPFFLWKGILLGRRAQVEGWTRKSLKEMLEGLLGSGVHCAPGGSEEIREVGIITGGAGSEVAAMSAEGIDTFITGEGPHHTYALAEEFGVNLFYAGHYATETFGVRALAAHLGEHYNRPHLFIDHPSGL
ncbi:MAG: Nif3-like dinuclear metal center hexameric protein [Verrucomicrobiales bacterium]|jgi:dinuclear metal center YbgI/SA1388 family protein|nr:Nif3-like dinuclear metal center hexameric protein [Verrucomicrobiales bacterium]